MSQIYEQIIYHCNNFKSLFIQITIYQNKMHKNWQTLVL